MSDPLDDLTQAVEDGLAIRRARAEEAARADIELAGDPSMLNVLRVGRMVARHVHRHGRCRPTGCLHDQLGSRNRRWRDEAIRFALANGWVAEDGRALVPGPVSP